MKRASLAIVCMIYIVLTITTVLPMLKVGSPVAYRGAAKIALVFF